VITVFTVLVLGVFLVLAGAGTLLTQILS